MKPAQYVSVDTIMAKLQRDLRRDDIAINDVIEWTGEAVQALGGHVALEPDILFTKVHNFACPLPPMFKMIIQIAKSNESEKDNITWLTSTTLPPEKQESVDMGVMISEEGIPLEDYEIAFFRPYFDLVGRFIGNNPKRLPKFSPVKLSNHTFFNSLVYKENHWKDLYASCQDEYDIQNGMLKFNFPYGYVAIAYLKIKTDCNGYPMIPDDFSSITAVTKYVTMKLMEIDFYAGRQGSEGRLAKAEVDWRWYCGQYGNKTLMPSTIDEWENLLRQRNYLIPRVDNYDSFFGNLSLSENPNLIK